MFFCFFRLSFLLTLFLTLTSQILESSENHPVLSLEEVYEYERNGNYHAALTQAKAYYQQIKDYWVDLYPDDIKSLIARLEKAVLEKGSTKRLFDENGLPRIKLMQLLYAVGMNFSPSLLTLTDIHQWTQLHLLRNGERWDLQTDKYESLKEKLFPLLKHLGFVDATIPSFKTYEGAIIQGALLPRVRARFHYLIEQWKNGVRFKSLYFLGGERPLVSQFENEDSFTHDPAELLKIRSDWELPQTLPQTEYEMMQLVWDQTEIPLEMRKNVKVFFTNAPMKLNKETGHLNRPTLNDTIEKWLELNPIKANYLVISNFPYVMRQDIALRTIASNGYFFDTIGPNAKSDEKIVIFLDEFARLIHQTAEYIKKNESNKN